MMNNDSVQEVLCRLDPDILEEAPAVTPRRRAAPRARSGLIAACLALLLVGGATAAVALSVIQTPLKAAMDLDIFTVQGPTGGAAYQVTEGFAYVPYEELGMELRACFEQLDHDKPYARFETWDELEQFLGYELANNPVLERLVGNVPQVRHSEAPLFHEIGFYGNDLLLRLRLASLYLAPVSDDPADGSYEVKVYGELATEESLRVSEHDLGQRYRFSDSAIVSAEDHVTPGGLTCRLTAVEYRGADNSPDAISLCGHILYTPVAATRNVCAADFTLNGVRYHIEVIGGSDLEESCRFLREIMDGFE